MRPWKSILILCLLLMAMVPHVAIADWSVAPSSAARMAAVREAGQAGEIAAGITGPKSGVLGPISGKMRFPDMLTSEVLRESKNVVRQGWTAQLKDYAAIAKTKNIPFELYVRQSTILSKPLQMGKRPVNHIW